MAEKTCAEGRQIEVSSDFPPLPHCCHIDPEERGCDIISHPDVPEE